MTLRICHKQPESERLTEGKVAAGRFCGAFCAFSNTGLGSSR